MLFWPLTAEFRIGEREFYGLNFARRKKYRFFTDFSSDKKTRKMPADKEVTRVDQDKINLFSRMNQRMTDIDASIATRKKTVTDIEDANEIVENLQIVEEDAPGNESTLVLF